MRLAYLAQSWIPSRAANSIHVMKMCQAFDQLGCTVTLFTPDFGSTAETREVDPYAFYGVAPCFDLAKLPWRGFKGRAFFYGWQASRLARDLAVDAAYGRCLHACAFAARSGIPALWDAHTATFLERPSQRLLFQWALTMPAFKGLTVNCQALKDVILERVPGISDRIIVAHNGADPFPDDLLPVVLGTPRGRPQIGYIGHLYPGKGFEIIQELAARAPWADFHVVGGEQADIDRLRQGVELPGNIELHGFVPPAMTDRYALAFDVLLAPYQSRVQVANGEDHARWMSPLKLFGYMAAGKPILCSDLPVLREIIKDGHNGLLLPADNCQAWLDALERVTTDEVERERLGTNAKTDFMTKHTWQQRARRVIQYLGKHDR